MSPFADPKRVYVVTQFGFGLSFALAWTLLGLYYVQDAGLQPLELLLVGAVLEGACFLLEIPTGVIADVYSRRLSVILACLFLGLGMLLIGLFPQFWVLLIAMVVCAAGYTCLSGAFQAWLADEIGEAEAARFYLVGSQANRAGGVIGILLTALLALSGLQVPILLGGLVTLLLGVYLKVFMPEEGFQPLPASERQTWVAVSSTFRHGLSEVRRSRVLTLLMLTGLLFGASGEVLERLKEFLLVRGVGLPVGLTPVLLFAGLALAAHLIGYGLTGVLLRRLHIGQTGQVINLLRLIIILSVGLMVVFAVSSNFWLAAAALVVYGVGTSLYGPLYTIWLNQGLSSRSRATVNSIASQADALGQVTVGPLFGLLGNVLGVRWALGLAALVRLPMVLLIGLAGRNALKEVQDSDIDIEGS
ncbi:MFS transporter [Deinococcus sp. UYEF24]